MITWLSNILSGRYRHWNDVNNRYVSVLVERAKNFPPPIGPLLVQFTKGSNILVDFLLGPDKGKMRIVKMDSNEVSAEQFKSLHHLNIWTFGALFGHSNPQFRDSFFAACKDFIGIRENEKQMAQFVLQMEELNIGNICSELLPEYTKILEYDGESDGVIDWYKLTSFFSCAYTIAMDAYKDELAKLE